MIKRYVIRGPEVTELSQRPYANVAAAHLMGWFTESWGLVEVIGIVYTFDNRFINRRLDNAKHYSCLDGRQ